MLCPDVKGVPSLTEVQCYRTYKITSAYGHQYVCYRQHSSKRWLFLSYCEILFIFVGNQFSWISWDNKSTNLRIQWSNMFSFQQ